MRNLSLLLVVLAMTIPGTPAPAGPRPASTEHTRELGWIHWGDDLDAARARAKASGRPVLILFQEIPGCGTCTGFGDGPLSNPLLIEAIESEFEPVAIHNNRPGRDAEVLARYGEPAWNNPVMRFVDADGKDVVPRRDGLWTEHEVAIRLIEALRAAKRTVPDYLLWAAEETDYGKQERGTFAMSCFWEGEAKLGALPGVVATRAGFLDGHEVVEVTWDRERLSYEKLLDTAGSMSCATKVYAHTPEQMEAAKAVVGDRAARTDAPAKSAPASDQTYSLNRTIWASLPLTPLQATRVNAALARGLRPDAWLTPGQLALAARMRSAESQRAGALATFARPSDPAALGEYRWKLAAAFPGGEGTAVR